MEENMIPLQPGRLNLEVVRQDYFVSQEEPQFTFKKGKAYINSAGLRMFPDQDYIQILVDKEEKVLIIKPLREKAKDSFRWSAGKKRQPRHMRCVPLYYMIYRMMGWNLNARYRITGTKLEYGSATVLFFRLSEAVCYVTEDTLDENGKPVVQELFPKEWEMKFGIAEAEHEEKDVVTVYEEDGLFEIKLPVKEDNLNRMMELAVEKMSTGGNEEAYEKDRADGENR
ncbi:MAG: hypothetical protein J6B50_11250 [Lachnospiraceae bacterium]|nr:hypothetical protein [Lachnospiraceae bacterium]MBP3595269.1 hypothetical protein [Lachnospiraceae bacterium]